MKLGMYPYESTWAHLNGVLHKSLKSEWVYISVIPLSLVGKNVTVAMNTHATELLDASFSMRSVSYQRKQATSSSQNFLFKKSDSQEVSVLATKVDRASDWSERLLTVVQLVRTYTGQVQGRWENRI
jgi:hypothetical protein